MQASLQNFRVMGQNFFFKKSYLLLCFLQLFPKISSLDIAGQLYFKSYVSENRFLGDKIKTQYYPFSDQRDTHIRFLLLCTFQEWCAALCFLSSGSAVLTDLYVSAGMTDTMAGDKAPCYTKRTRVLYPKRGVSITASNTASNAAVRVIENMEDGVYGFGMGECYYSKANRPHILIELSESRSITQIALRTQPAGTTGDKFSNLIVRVGDTEPIGTDFSMLSYFGKYDTDPPALNTDVIIENAAGVVGKYISIQEESNRDMQVGAIEITGF